MPRHPLPPFVLRLFVLLGLLALVGLGTPAAADDEGADTRFHDAYVREVIEGRVAEAARDYLALMEDDGTPDRIRAEATFRFAICTVLLGRPDEGRARLRTLVRDTHAPEALRQRATDYLDEIGDLGVGTELDRKREALLQGLGRANSNAVLPPVYRDVEILGPRAVPFLRGLLAHNDVSLRRHAFRLLCRMNEPGMMSAWTPEIGFLGQNFNLDVVRYVGRRPQERPALEQQLLALEDAPLARQLSGFGSYHPAFSLAFVQALADRSAVRETAFGFLETAGDAAGRWKMLRPWLRTEDPSLRLPAARWALTHHEEAPPAERDADYPVVIRAYAAELANTWFTHRDALAKWSAAVPAKTLLDALEGLVKQGEREGVVAATFRSHPLLGLADTVALALDGKPAAEVDLPRYAKLLERWLARRAALRTQLERVGQGIGPPGSRTRHHLAHVARNLPEADGAAFVRRLFSGPLAGSGADDIAGDILHIDAPERVALLVAAWEGARASDRRYVLDRFPGVLSHADAALARALLQALPALVPSLPPPGFPAQIARWYASYGLALPAKERRERFAALLDAARTRPGSVEADVIRSFFKRASSVGTRTSSDQRGFFATTGVDVLGEDWGQRDAPARQVILQIGFEVLTRAGTDLTPPVRAHLVAFLRAHLDETPSELWRTVAVNPADFPRAAWVRFAPVPVLESLRLPDGADDVARVLTKDPTRVNASVLVYVLRNASPDTQRRVFDRVLSGGPSPARFTGIQMLVSTFGAPASVAVLERLLTDLLAEKPGDLDQIEGVASMLKQRHPSPRLFPAATRLMQAPDAIFVRSGIALAKALGRETLVPELAKLLDSFDDTVRDRAKQAIDAIRDLARLRQRETGR